jgi:hypothetical protein
MPRETLGDVLYDLVAEVTRHRDALLDEQHDDLVESAHTAARVLERAIKDGQVPAAPEVLRKVRAAKRKLKAALEEDQGEFEDDALDDVDTEPPAAKGKKKDGKAPA